MPVPVPAPGYFDNGVDVPPVLCHGRKELTDVPGTGMGSLTDVTDVPGTGIEVLQNSQKSRVRV